ncbi:MAG: potassium/proton antiporter [Burkholderiales bacterium]|nr:potassium/proton antiporter [Burkholderiales bacterium]
METLNQFLLIGATVMFAGIFFAAFSSRLGIPFLLVFLVVGMLAGEDGPGGIVFDDYRLSFLVANLALAIILLDGGLRTRLTSFKAALRPSLALATVGVVATAVLTGLFAAWVLDVNWRFGLLLGAIVGSTDAAAVFALLRASGTRLNDRVATTLEIESGINDPMAVFLTVTMIELVSRGGELLVADMAWSLAVQFSIGAIAGIALGYLLSEVLRHVRVGGGLQALLLSSGGVAIFGITNLVGGSGFLAVYLVGLVIGNRRQRTSEDVLRAMDGMAWLAQSSMFLLLGLLVAPGDIVEVAWLALAVSAFLMFVARPAAVCAILLPLGFAWREVGFIAWMGLRGAVPIVLGMFPLMAGLEGAGLLFNVAFVVVLTSLLFQGVSIGPTARLFRVALPTRAEPLARSYLEGSADPPLELAQFRLEPEAALEGGDAGSVELPAPARLLSVLRDGQAYDIETAGALRAGDVVTLVAPEAQVDRIAGWFSRAARAAVPRVRKTHGEFVLDGSAELDEIVAHYGGAPLDPALHGRTLDEVIRSRLPLGPVEGDAVEVAGLRFTVRTVSGSRIVQAAIALPGARRGPERR